MSGKHQPPYPPEFRAEALALVRSSGKSRRAIAQKVGISTETLRQWVKQAAMDAGQRHDGLTTSDREEVRRLRREIKELREEREILNRAAAFPSTPLRTGFATETDARR